MLLRLIKRKLSFIFLLYVLILFAFNACENPIMMKLLDPLVQEKNIEKIKKANIEMILIPGGSFEMGNDKGENDEKPVHKVTLSSFYMGKYEVTYALYEAVMGSSPQPESISTASGEVQEKRPVRYLNWYDAIVFCNKLSMAEKLSPAYSVLSSTNPANWGAIPTKEGESWNVVVVDGSYGYRLPTEAQWEYAARGGKGSPEDYIYSGSVTLDDVAWYSENSNSKTHEVGKKKPNGLGLYDMIGNVKEWCWDWKGIYPSGAQTDPVGVFSGGYRVVRGGSWTEMAGFARSTYRSWSSPYSRFYTNGFRIVRPVDSATANSTFTVTFDADGGTPAPKNFTAKYDYIISQPFTMTKTGYVFDNWYTDTNKTIPAVFPIFVNSKVNLYAKWIPLIIEMIQIPGGSFEMGSNKGFPSEKPVHTVKLSGFYMGKYEVTQEQWTAVMGSNPSKFTSSPVDGEAQSKRPVECVSWYDALVFCNKLSVLEKLSPAYSISGNTNPAEWGSIPTDLNSTGWSVVVVDGSNGYRLPTEAQWEYAARGGNGSTGDYTYSGSNTLNNVAWYKENSNDKTHEVGKKEANGLGLHDMSGNVSEWCWDREYLYSSEEQTNPTGASSGPTSMIRGGAWNAQEIDTRSTVRHYTFPFSRYDHLGFRLVRPDSSATNPTFFTVTFDANGGSGTIPVKMTETAGSDITLPEGSGLSRTGFTFGGWNTNADGSGIDYYANDKFTVTGNVTFYAKWVKDNDTPGLDLARAEQVSLSNGWYAVYRFDLPTGKTWRDYQGLSADYMFEAEDLAAATSRNGRLMGPYQPSDFMLYVGTGDVEGKKMAIANYNNDKNYQYILDNGKLPWVGSLIDELNNVDIIVKGGEWFTYYYNISGSLKNNQYDMVANYPADTDPGPFYFALGLPSAAVNPPNNYYIRDVTLIGYAPKDNVIATPAYFEEGGIKYPAFTGFNTPDGSNGYAEAARSMVDGSPPKAVPK